ncbi:MAG: hypothetical protein P8Y27_03020 [Chromatiaceae bacterium]
MNDITQVQASPEDLSLVLTAATQAVTDSMVERLAVTGANALELVDRLNDEETREALLAALDAVTRLHKMGALDTLVEVAMVVHAARTAVSDSMVERLFAFGEHMFNNLATEEVATLAHVGKKALEDAVDHVHEAPVKPGIRGTLKMLSTPEAAQTLQFMLSFGNNLRERAKFIQKSDLS